MRLGDDVTDPLADGTTAEPACPLCGRHRADEIESVAWSTVAGALKALTGSAPPDGLLPRDLSARLRRLSCPTCGLEWVTPLWSGSAAFYEYLSDAGDYYDADRWDFDRARALVGGSDAVVDLGCGGGAFLAGLSCRRRLGVDQNPHGVAQAHRLGIEALLAAPGEIPSSLDRSFDVVCSFQVLEHLERVAEVMAPACRLVRPGGLIVVSVPNRLRVPVNETPVLDWPPHHLSRWGPDQLHRLAERWGLEVVSLHCDRRSPARTAQVAAYVASLSIAGRSPVAALDGARRPEVTWKGLRFRHTMAVVLRAP